jgi:signal transduction histidine kinase
MQSQPVISINANDANSANQASMARPPHSMRSHLLRVVGTFLVLLGPLVLVAGRLFPEVNTPIFNSGIGHFLVALAGALLGLALAWLVLVTGRRARDRRALLIGLALLATALLFCIHAVSTPNVVLGATGSVPGISAQLSLIVCSFFFAASSLNLPAAVDRFITRRSGLLMVVVVGCCALCAWYLLRPMPGSPAIPGDAALSAGHTHELAGPGAAAAPARIPPAVMQTLYVLSTLCYLFAIWRYLQIARRSPSKISMALLYGTMLFCMALIMQSLCLTFTPLFWVYHIQELSGFLVLSAALLLAYQQGQAGTSLIESLLLPNTRFRIEANYASALDELIASLSRGERPTAALRHMLQQRFGLVESQVQALERAAQAVASERRQRVELEELTSRLQQLQHDKELLLQLVVHDLKNPLTALLGFLDMLSRDGLTQDQQELAASALRSAKNLEDLIGDLLDVAQLEEGRLDLRYSSFELAVVLADVTREMQAWARQEDQTLWVEIEQPIVLDADLRLIRRVLRNLISNAIKHTPNGSTITVCACSSATGDDMCQIDVQDDGLGIPEDMRDVLFERFGRSEAQPMQRQQSTGLGLFFCKLAIEAHGGSISVKSTSHGTTFSIQLPRGHVHTPTLPVAQEPDIAEQHPAYSSEQNT